MNIKKFPNFKPVILLEKNNIWAYDNLKKILKKNNQNKLKIISNLNGISNKLVFAIGYTKKIRKNFLTKNKVFIVHNSKLPLDRGWSPMQAQVLRGNNKIFITLFEANNFIDKGLVALKISYNLDGTELNDELRLKQSVNSIKIINLYLKNLSKIKLKPQKGKATYNKKRNYFSNLININKSIKSQFNILRVSDNNHYPAHFNYKGIKYFLKIKKK